MADHGFALTIPVGSVAFDIEGDLEAEVGAVSNIGEGREAGAEASSSDARSQAAPTRHHRPEARLRRPVHDPSAPPGALEDFTLDDLVALVADELRAMEPVDVVRGPEALDLPSGPAYVIDITQPGPAGPEVSVPTAIYLVARPGEYRTIYCLGRPPRPTTGCPSSRHGSGCPRMPAR